MPNLALRLGALFAIVTLALTPSLGWGGQDKGAAAEPVLF